MLVTWSPQEPTALLLAFDGDPGAAEHCAKNLHSRLLRHRGRGVRASAVCWMGKSTGNCGHKRQPDGFPVDFPISHFWVSVIAGLGTWIVIINFDNSHIDGSYRSIVVVVSCYIPIG